MLITFKTFRSKVFSESKFSLPVAWQKVLRHYGCKPKDNLNPRLSKHL